MADGITEREARLFLALLGAVKWDLGRTVDDPSGRPTGEEVGASCETLRTVVERAYLEGDGVSERDHEIPDDDPFFDAPTYSGRETVDELLDWLCWSWATTGKRFYPPDETAAECIRELDTDDEFKRGYEHGYHARAWSDAVDRFDDLEARGFDPKVRAKRYVQHASEQGSDLEAIDWSWYDDDK